MARKKTTDQIQDIINIMDKNNLNYLELQHPTLGLVKLQKNTEAEQTTADPIIPYVDIEQKNDFTPTDEDFLFASI